MREDRAWGIAAVPMILRDRLFAHLPNRSDLAMAIGLAALAIPVLVDLARDEWITDQGSQGPIMLVLGLWLIARDWRPSAEVQGVTTHALLALVPVLAIYVLTRITGQQWLAWMMVMACVTLACVVRGGWTDAGRRALAIAFLALLAPPPGFIAGPLVDWLNPAIAAAAVSLFRIAGVEAASSGTMIYVGPYEMQMTDACAGMGSLISLFAICVLYLSLRHGGVWRYMLAIAPLLAAVAVFANLLRVVLLMLVTLRLGDRAAQGWFHPMAGLILFAGALSALIALDAVLSPMRLRLSGLPR